VSPLVHGMIAWLIAIFILKDVNDRRLAIIAGVIPDIDGIFVLFNNELFLKYHHTLGHSFVYGVLITIVAAGLAKDKKKVGLAAFLAFSLHLFSDYIGSDWAIFPFYPVSNIDITIASYLPNFMIYFIINPIAFIIILLIIILVVYKKQVSPLEFISKKLDERFVNFYILPLKYKCYVCEKRAWYKCISCGRMICAKHGRGVIKTKCQVCSQIKKTERFNG
jgi:hypothetical protein